MPTYIRMWASAFTRICSYISIAIHLKYGLNHEFKKVEYKNQKILFLKKSTAQKS